MNSRIPGYALLLFAFVAGFVIAGCTGCATRSIGKIELPDISAASITYKRSDPAGGTVITAKGVVDHGAYVTADQLNLTTIYPSFSVSIDVEKYVRYKSAPTPPPAAVPPAAPAAPVDVNVAR